MMQLGSIQSLIFHQDKNNNYMKVCNTFQMEVQFWNVHLD